LDQVIGLTLFEHTGVGMNRVWLAGAVGVAAILCATGCGGPDIDTVKVTGKVTVAGQPVKDIIVSLLPDAGGPVSRGITDASGNFTLSTLSSGDGAIPGKYKVSFGVASTGEPPPSDLTTSAATPSIPFNTKYSSAETSGITADVAAGKANVLPTWDLEK
jgi:hypothetical protein